MAKNFLEKTVRFNYKENPTLQIVFCHIKFISTVSM